MGSTKDCVFCRIGREVKSNKRLSEGELFFHHLDVHPASPGHTLIIPFRHVETLDDLTEEEWLALRRKIKEVKALIVRTTRDELSEAYKEIQKKRITANSVTFINRALAHRYFGEPPHGYNQGVNEGEAAGQTVPHLHWHVIPRYDGDMPDPRGGVRYVIPEMGNYTIPRT
jgi:ATP adenylyltransferase